MRGAVEKAARIESVARVVLPERKQRPHQLGAGRGLDELEGARALGGVGALEGLDDQIVRKPAREAEARDHRAERVPARAITKCLGDERKTRVGRRAKGK